MTNKEVVDFLALVVHRGFLSRDQGRACFEALQRGEDLDTFVKSQEWVSDNLWNWIRSTGAGKQPRFPGFEIVASLGVGGTAEVFKARELKEDRECAIKVLDQNLVHQPAALRSFTKECKLLLDLDHPNIVKGYRLAKLESIYFCSMELVEGPTVLEMLDSKSQFDEDTSLYIVLQTARALEYLRGRGIVHGDIKPGNIMVGAGERVKIIDLGFASQGSEGEAPQETTRGTAAYISPEMARGASGVDIRSDIYSLGATLYQLVLGKLPFEGENSEELLRKQVMESLSAAELKGKAISPHLHYFIEKMMAKDPDLRYQSPAELIADIEVQIEGKKTLSYSREGDASLKVDLEMKSDEPATRPAVTPAFPVAVGTPASEALIPWQVFPANQRTCRSSFAVGAVDAVAPRVRRAASGSRRESPRGSRAVWGSAKRSSSSATRSATEIAFPYGSMQGVAPSSKGATSVPFTRRGRNNVPAFRSGPSVLESDEGLAAAAAVCPGIEVRPSPEQRKRAFARLAELYAALEQEMGRQDPAPVCELRGVCCDFERADHVLYASRLETDFAAEQLAELGPEARKAPADRTLCPYWDRGRCGNRAGRPLGCRTYFCDPSWEGRGERIYEKFYAEIRAIAEATGYPWSYDRFVTALPAELRGSTREREIPGLSGNEETLP